MTAKKDTGAEMGERIKGAREAEGLTQAQLGRALDVTRAAVGGWEKGQYAPEPKHWETLAKILKTTVTYLVAGRGIKPPLTTEEDRQFVRLTRLHLRNMIIEGRFDEAVHSRIVLLLKSGAIEDLLREHGYFRKDGP
jgi:transcriptional regulator with XRE-family HTH domain